MEEINEVAVRAKEKVTMLKTDFVKYLISSILAGFYVGLGIAFVYTCGGMLAGTPYVKIAMGALFAVSLSLIVMAGAELFTGNNMYMTIGVIKKTVSIADALKLWAVCYAGNLIGALLLAFMYHATGLADINPEIGALIVSTSSAKMIIPIFPLFMRGILCNIFVCAAVWCCVRMKSESGKLIVIFWCMFAFVTTGYEHSIANMSLLVLGLLNKSGESITMLGCFYNIGIATIGNIAGGALFAAVYALVGREKKKRC